MRLPAILCVSIFLLGSCGNPAGNKDGATITIATLKGPSSMGMIKFIDSLDHAAGRDIAVRIMNEPLQIRKMMLDGSADLAVLPTNMAAIVYNKGLDYRLIAIPVWGTLYLFGNDTTIKEWQDLKHKKVNVMARGMTPDVLFRYLLQKNGINPDKDIELDYRFPTHIDLANAVASGKASLGVISEPLVSQVMRRNQEVRMLFDLNREWISLQGFPIPQTALMAKKSVIQDDPALIEKILDAYQRSVQWVNDNPDSAAVLIVKHRILDDIQTARQAIPGSGLRLVRSAAISRQIQDYLHVFFVMNPQITGGKMPDEEFYY
ncbi:MAG TPA: ABC transporter substrate-binding protein [Bacteroidales bacterium]|nr:ABC transporter substrate-binding protein [Bacteroidales bacterium]HQB56101.1 ABC transporter substrate-binding protein [Bacteroidales bacterium]